MIDWENLLPELLGERKYIQGDVAGRAYDYGYNDCRKESIEILKSAERLGLVVPGDKMKQVLELRRMLSSLKMPANKEFEVNVIVDKIEKGKPSI